jgi:predicted DCC family thiol-disulfide oxidoreductase YuxK
MSGSKDQVVLLFDGVCNLCNSSVRFILKRERAAEIQFASIQSDAAQKLLLHYNYKITDLRTILFIEQGKIHERSAALLRICTYLKLPWRIFTAFRILPGSWLDRGYDLVASNRYRWFGKRDKCTMFLPEYKNRFIQ